MKACIIQPLYSTDCTRLDELFQTQLDALDACDETMDIIVLPESCDVPCLEKTREGFCAAADKYAPKMIAKAQETAKRCNAIVFFNVSGEGYRNSTFAVDRSGNIVGEYGKVHLVPSEIHERARESSYCHEPQAEPYTVLIEGLRFAFLTCYDFYFYEMYSNIARQNVDIIIGCSHQRSDTHEALEIITRHLAYNTNAHVLRASVSMGEDSPLGGCSMVVSPRGEVLGNMHSRIGSMCIEFDPANKYFKPAGFGGTPAAHWEYIERGRHPWKYRFAGTAITPPDTYMKYPRLCAHRGFSTAAPENSLPAYGAAVAMGADEIEFDVWATSDGVLVSTHDRSLERVSNGHGNVDECTFDYIRSLDFGGHFSEHFRGLRCPTVEEILAKFAGHAVMNIHVKIWDLPDSEEKKIDRKFEELAALIRKYDCAGHCYFMNTYPEMLVKMREFLPEAHYCAGGGRGNDVMVEDAIKYRLDKVQFMKTHPFDKSMIDRLHAHGILCNIFWSDDPEEAKRFLDMGIDTILTNDLLALQDAVSERLHKYYGFRR